MAIARSPAPVVAPSCCRVSCVRSRATPRRDLHAWQHAGALRRSAGQQETPSAKAARPDGHFERYILIRERPASSPTWQSQRPRRWLPRPQHASVTLVTSACRINCALAPGRYALPSAGAAPAAVPAAVGNIAQTISSTNAAAPSIARARVRSPGSHCSRRLRRNQRRPLLVDLDAVCGADPDPGSAALPQLDVELRFNLPGSAPGSVRPGC